MSQSIFVKLFPIELAWKDPEQNIFRMRKALEVQLQGLSTLQKESMIAVFPEMTLTGFVLEDVNPLEANSQIVRSVRDLALEFGVAIVFGYPEKGPSTKPWNRLELISSQGELVGYYRKKKLFTRGTPAESDLYSPGESSGVFSYRGWKIALRICFDLRFSELFDPLRKESVDLIILSACWLGGPHKADQFRILSAARAISTQSYLAAVNRSGADPYFSYEGDAYVFRPQGDTLSDSGAGYCLTTEALLEARKLKLQ